MRNLREACLLDRPVPGYWVTWACWLIPRAVSTGSAGQGELHRERVHRQRERWRGGDGVAFQRQLGRAAPDALPALHGSDVSNPLSTLWVPAE